MEIDSTTFILEIVNFLVLVWLLQRFFYKPLLDVIDRRKARIDNALAEAARVQKEAGELQTQCNERLSHWEQEKRDAQENLQRDIEQQRTHLLGELKIAVETEHNKIRVIEERRRSNEQRKLETAALQNAAGFASLLLKYAAGPELEKRLFDLLLEQLAELPPESADALLLSNHQEELAAITVSSAYTLDDAQRAALQQRLDALLGRHLSYDYKQDTELLAGLRIVIGAWVLGVNLQDELHGFTQFVHA